MKTAALFVASVAILATSVGCHSRQQAKIWQAPPVVTPADSYGDPPSDSIVLFDGNDTSQWVAVDGKSPIKWKIENGYMEVVPKSGNILTRRGFGDCQLHIEWATPAQVKGHGQERGNSGIFFMNLYEVQVLDSYQNATYFDGMAGSIYGQSPPRVNACRPPGQWQSYDIIFHRPHFKGNKCMKPARMTVFQNGVIVQDNYELEGITTKKPAFYKVHADKESLQLQDHNNPVQFRNIWIRELPSSR